MLSSSHEDWSTIIPTEKESIGSETNKEKSGEETTIHTTDQCLDSSKWQTESKSDATITIPVTGKGLDFTSNLEIDVCLPDMHNTDRVCTAITPPGGDKIIEATSRFDSKIDESTTIHATGLDICSIMGNDIRCAPSGIQNTNGDHAAILPSHDCRSIETTSTNDIKSGESTNINVIGFDVPNNLETGSNIVSPEILYTKGSCTSITLVEDNSIESINEEDKSVKTSPIQKLTKALLQVIRRSFAAVPNPLQK